MSGQPYPKTPAQLQANVTELIDGPARLVKLAPEPWRLAKRLRLDTRRRRLRVAYGAYWPDEQGQLQVLVAEFTWDA